MQQLSSLPHETPDMPTQWQSHKSDIVAVLQKITTQNTTMATPHTDKSTVNTPVNCPETMQQRILNSKIEQKQ